MDVTVDVEAARINGKVFISKPDLIDFLLEVHQQTEKGQDAAELILSIVKTLNKFGNK